MPVCMTSPRNLGSSAERRRRCKRWRPSRIGLASRRLNAITPFRCEKLTNPDCICQRLRVTNSEGMWAGIVMLAARKRG